MQYPQLLQKLSCNKVLLFSNANGVLGQLARNTYLAWHQANDSRRYQLRKTVHKGVLSLLKTIVMAY